MPSSTSDTRKTGASSPKAKDTRPGANLTSPKKENNQPASTSQIVSWGTTTGKLYLSDPGLDQTKSRSVATEYLGGKGIDSADGDREGAGKKAGEGDNGKREDVTAKK